MKYFLSLLVEINNKQATGKSHLYTFFILVPPKNWQLLTKSGRLFYSVSEGEGEGPSTCSTCWYNSSKSPLFMKT